MSKFKLEHHSLIESALSNFNADFFIENRIFFGGGTRIALELEEFRKSIDIDFLCPDKQSYRAVREHVTNVSLGKLVKKDFEYAREIMFNRDSVRVMFKYMGSPLKLEFVCFDNYDLNCISDEQFPVPYLDRESCFYTKLMSHTDRCMSHPYKDIVDILAMYDSWGDIPASAFLKAESHYGQSIRSSLIRAVADVISNQDIYSGRFRDLDIDDKYAHRLVSVVAPSFRASIEQK